MHILISIKRFLKTVINIPVRLIALFRFLFQWFHLKGRNDKRFDIKARDLYPCLSDKTSTTPIDAHYTYHPAWAARVLAQTRPGSHVDISSILSFSTICSAFLPIKFYDYRPAHLQLTNFDSEFADLKNLPFADNSIESLSCMHTIEHIGLGRYGDELDIKGDIKAVDEIIRTVTPDGDILFVTPVGKSRIEFNAHRIYGYEQVIDLFHDCRLIEFSLITDNGEFISNAEPGLVKHQNYGCGCFWFKKKSR